MMSSNGETSWSRRSALKAVGATGVALVGTAASSGTAAASGPTAVITTDPKLPAVSGTDITFDGSQSEGDIVKYEWWRDAADNVVSGVDYTGQTFTEAFAEGDFTVKLRVTDSSGNTDTTKFSFISYGSSRVTNPTANIQMWDNGGGEITFDGTQSTSPRGDIVKYEWWRDAAGGSLTGVDFTGPGFFEHFSEGNDFAVKLRVTDETGQTATEKITFTA